MSCHVNSNIEHEQFVVTSRNIYPVLILGPLIIFFTYVLIYGIFYNESWWFKFPFLFLIPLIFIWIWMIIEGGYISGRIKCIITKDGLTYSCPLTWIGKRLEIKKNNGIITEFTNLQWDEVKLISCDDQNFELRKRNSEIPRLLRVLFTTRTGEKYKIDESAFLEKKFKSIYERIKEEAHNRQIPLDTNLENSEVWKRKIRNK